MSQITSQQIRAARGLIRWSQRALAEASGVSHPTIKRMEGSDGPIRGITENVWRLQSALEAAGVEFIDEDGGGPGVRLRDKLEG